MKLPVVGWHCFKEGSLSLSSQDVSSGFLPLDAHALGATSLHQLQCGSRVKMPCASHTAVNSTIPTD
jgi:hypothetical protein